MTVNLIPLTSFLPMCGCAALTIATLGLFARQNRKSGWVRNRPNAAEALEQLYRDLGVSVPAPNTAAPAAWTAVTPEEAIGFSAQMLKLRGALGTSTAIGVSPQVQERELVWR